MTVTVLPRPGWKRVSTGLDPVPGKPGTFTAPDFDTLYDCPILVGNQEILTFEAAGLPHTVAAYDLGSFDRTKFTGDLKRIVEAAAALMGEIPYRHYTFLIIGPGGGGLEHLNSTAVTLNPGFARRRARLSGLAELHRPRVFPPLQRQVHPARRSRALRLRPRELHGHALVLRGGARSITNSCFSTGPA